MPAVPDINFELFAIRVRSFFLEALSLIIVACLGVLASPEFGTVIATHFGTGLAGSLVLLAVNGLIKHIRNRMEIDKVQREAEETLGSPFTPVELRGKISLV